MAVRHIDQVVGILMDRNPAKQHATGNMSAEEGSLSSTSITETCGKIKLAATMYNTTYFHVGLLREGTPEIRVLLDVVVGSLVESWAKLSWSMQRRRGPACSSHLVASPLASPSPGQDPYCLKPWRTNGDMHLVFDVLPAGGIRPQIRVLQARHNP